MFKVLFVSSFLAFFLVCVSVRSAPIPGDLRNTFRSIQAREVFTGGKLAKFFTLDATYFLQNGVAGACGTVHSDSDFIAAMDQTRYGDSGDVSPLCGKYVKITNILNQKTVTVQVADDCPTCNNENSIDLSQGAFTQIATIDEGEVPITWEYVDSDGSSSTDNSSSGDDTDNGSDDGSNSDSGSGSNDDWSSD
ncbi:RlpA-like double-psi beta-barrel-protein domain-containing protein-containing protein [Lentinula novae-zelandiae]|nr:RlpA-like double-psi beta-barrel-protein domain-containing protein-containing protein [Lentinula novae-zelandiae]